MGTNDNDTKNNRCFVIMPFSSPQGYEDGHFERIYEQIIKPAVEEAGFQPERVDENVLSTDIVTKIFQGLTECDMAICDLSSRNPNVLYELGIRQAYNMPVLLIKDEKTDDIFDVGGLTTIPYSSTRLYENVVEAREKISEALIKHAENKESVINIIKGRLKNFKESEKPSVEMNSDDRILSLLYSIMEDVDLIKSRTNYNFKSSERITKSEIKIVRTELMKIYDELNNKLLNCEKVESEIYLKTVEKYMVQCKRYLDFTSLDIAKNLVEIKNFIESAVKFFDKKQM